MAQSTIIRRNGSTPAKTKISNPMSRTRIEKISRRTGAAKTYPFIATGFIAVVVVFAWFGDSGHGANVVDSSEKNGPKLGALRQAMEEGMPLPSSASSVRNTNLRISEEDGRNREQRQKSSENEHHHGGAPHPSSIDTVIGYLLALAQQSPAKLWDTLGLDASPDADESYGTNPFALQELESGQCPWSEAERVEWLPPVPNNSEEIASAYRSRTDTLMSEEARKRGRTEHSDSKQKTVIWYEHISKAGGTSFCGMANSNMPMWEVPRYHCMPRKGELMDGRVGSWTNQEVIGHVRTEKHAILANEWEPFSLDKLKLSGRAIDESKPPAKLDAVSPQLLFLTTLRDPQDRLLSAYTFFSGKVGFPPEQGSKAGPYAEWINNNRRRSQTYKIGTRNAFRSNTARQNHIVWRFSGGALSIRKNREKEWETAFETAVRSLAQQDLILPMDLMTAKEGKRSLETLLGWKTFKAKLGRRKGNTTNGNKDSGHVVTTGGVKNSNARSYFSAEEYQAQWEENWLDNLLCLWCRAVFLVRLHCDK